MTLLEVRGASKRYPGVQALADVDFDVGQGEVHGLLGENGAGKSTLMKIVAGSVEPDAGTMTMAEQAVPFGSPDVARDRGIGIVYQELSLVPTLSVAENVFLGRWPRTRFGLVDWKTLRDEAARHLERVGLAGHDPDERTEPLSMADRQLVEIAKALSSDVRILLLDEPTSALSGPEGERLFEIIEGLTDEGVGIVYVSHRLGEVMEIADRVTVLRDGERIATEPIDAVDERQLARMMVGREVGGAQRIVEEAAQAVEAEERSDQVVLCAEGLGRPPRLQPLDLELRQGEIVGVFGLVGSGRSQLGRTLFGLEPPTQGRLEVAGREVSIRSPRDASAVGMGYLSQDRAHSVVPRMGATSNITLASLDRISRGPLLDAEREREIGERFIEELDIRVRSPDQLGETLSGGNQQKVVLARWLASESRILILDDPTRGIDVGAKEEVFRLVTRLSAQGVSILYLTSEIREAKALADRILVMANRRVVGEFEPDVSDEQIMEAAGGAHD